MAFLQLEFRHPQLSCWLPAGHPLLPPAFQNIGNGTRSTQHHAPAHSSCIPQICSGAPSLLQMDDVELNICSSTTQKTAGTRDERSGCCMSRLSNRSRCCCTLLPLPQAASVIDLEALPRGVTLVFGRKSVSNSILPSTETQPQHQAPDAAGDPPEISTAAQGVAVELPTPENSDVRCTETKAWTALNEGCGGGSATCEALWKFDATQEGSGMQQHQSTAGETAFVGRISPPSTLALSDQPSVCVSTRGNSCGAFAAPSAAADFAAPSATSCPAAGSDPLHLPVPRRRPSSCPRDTCCDRPGVNSGDNESSSNSSSRVSDDSRSNNSRSRTCSGSNGGSDNGSDTCSDTVIYCRGNSSGRESKRDRGSGRGSICCNEEEGEKKLVEENPSGEITRRERCVYFPSTDPLLSRRHFFITRQRVFPQERQSPGQQQPHQERPREWQLHQEGGHISSSTSGHSADNARAVFVVAAKASSTFTEAGDTGRWGVRGLLLLNTSSAASVNKDLRVRQAALPPAVRAAVSAAIAADDSGGIAGAAPLFCGDTGCSSSSRSPPSPTPTRSRRGSRGSGHVSSVSSTAASSNRNGYDSNSSSHVGAACCSPQNDTRRNSSSSRITHESSHRSRSLRGGIGSVEHTKISSTRMDKGSMHNSKCSSNGDSSSEGCAGLSDPATRPRCGECSPRKARGSTRAAAAAEEEEEEDDVCVAAAGAETAAKHASQNEAATASRNISCHGEDEERTATVRQAPRLPTKARDIRQTAFTHFVYEPHELQDGDQLYIPIDDALLLQQQQQKSCCILGKKNSRQLAAGYNFRSAANVACAETEGGGCAATDCCSPVVTSRMHNVFKQRSHKRDSCCSNSISTCGQTHFLGDDVSSDDNSSSSSGKFYHSSITNACGVPDEGKGEHKWNFSSELCASDSTTRSSNAAATGETSSRAAPPSSNSHSSSNSSAADTPSSLWSSSCHVCGRYTPLFCFRYVFRRRRDLGVSPVAATATCVDNSSSGAARRSSRPDAAATLLPTAAPAAAFCGAPSAGAAATWGGAPTTAATAAAATGACGRPALSEISANEGARERAGGARTRGAAALEAPAPEALSRGGRAAVVAAIGIAAAAEGRKGATAAAGTAATPRKQRNAAAIGEQLSHPVAAKERSAVEGGANTPSAATQESTSSFDTVALDQIETEAETHRESPYPCASPSAAIASVTQQSAATAAALEVAVDDHSHEVNEVLAACTASPSTSAAVRTAAQDAAASAAPAPAAFASAAACLSSCAGAAAAADASAVSTAVFTPLSPRHCQQQCHQSSTRDGSADAAVAANCRPYTRQAAVLSVAHAENSFAAAKPGTPAAAAAPASSRNYATAAAAASDAGPSCCSAVADDHPSYTTSPLALRRSPAAPASSSCSPPAAAAASTPHTSPSAVSVAADSGSHSTTAKAVEPYVRSRYFVQPSELRLHKQQLTSQDEQQVTDPAADGSHAAACHSRASSSSTTTFTETRGAGSKACISYERCCRRPVSNDDSTSRGGQRSDCRSSRTKEARTGGSYDERSNSSEASGRTAVSVEESSSPRGKTTAYNSNSSNIHSNSACSHSAYHREESASTTGSDNSSGSLVMRSSSNSSSTPPSSPTNDSICTSGNSAMTSGGKSLSGHCSTNDSSTSDSSCAENKKPVAGARLTRGEITFAARSDNPQSLSDPEAAAAARGCHILFTDALDDGDDEDAAAVTSIPLEAAAGDRQRQHEPLPRSRVCRGQRSHAEHRQQESHGGPPLLRAVAGKFKCQSSSAPLLQDNATKAQDSHQPASKYQSASALLLQDNATKTEVSYHPASSSSWDPPAASLISRRAPTTDPTTTTTTARDRSTCGAEQLQSSSRFIAGTTDSASSNTGLWWRDFRRRRGPVAGSSGVCTPATLSSTSSSSSSSGTTSSSCSSSRANERESCSTSPFSIIPSPLSHARLQRETPQRAETARSSLAAAAAAGPRTASTACAVAAAPAPAADATVSVSCTAATTPAITAAVPATVAAAAPGGGAHGFPDVGATAAAGAHATTQEESEAIEDIVDALEDEVCSNHELQLSTSQIAFPRPLPLSSPQKHLGRSQEGQQVAQQHQRSSQQEQPVRQQPPFLALQQNLHSQQQQPLHSRRQPAEQSPQQPSHEACPGRDRHSSETHGFFCRAGVPLTPERQSQQPQHHLHQQQRGRLQERPHNPPPQQQQQLHQRNQRVEHRQGESFGTQTALDRFRPETEPPLIRQQVALPDADDEECLAVDDILNAVTPTTEGEASTTMQQELFLGGIQEEQRQEPLVQQHIEQNQPPHALAGPDQQPREPRDEGSGENEVKVLLVTSEDKSAQQQHVCTAGECCAICKEELVLQQEIACLPACSHFFCFPCIAKWACCVKKKQRPPCPLCKQNFSSLRRYVRRNSSAVEDSQQQQWLRGGVPAAGRWTSDLPAERYAGSGTRTSRLSSSCNSNNSGNISSSSSNSSSGNRSPSGGGTRERDVQFLFVETIQACLEALLRHRPLRAGAAATGGGERWGDELPSDADGERAAAELMLLSSQTSSSSEAAAGAGGCQVCGEDTDWTSMLLCDGCDEGFHLYCLNPPLQCVPAGRWFCPRCCEESSAAATATRGGTAATAVAARAAAGRRQRVLLRDHSTGSSTRQSEGQQRRPRGRQQQQQQRQRQRHQGRHPRQRQSPRDIRSRRPGREMQQRRTPTKDNRGANESDTHRGGERYLSSEGGDSPDNGSSSSSGSSAWMSLQRHGWLEQFLYRLPGEVPGQASATGASASAADAPTQASSPTVPTGSFGRPAAPAAAVTAASATAAPTGATTAAAVSLSSTVERGEAWSSLRGPSAVGSSEEDVVESVNRQRRRKRRRVSSLSEGENITEMQVAGAGGRRARQQHLQQYRSRTREILCTERRCSSSNGEGSARISSEDINTDGNGTARSAVLSVGDTEELLFSPLRRGANGGRAQLRQRYADQRERLEGGENTRIMSGELRGEESDEYDRDGFVVSDADPLVPASESGTKSSSTGSSSSSFSEEELQSTSRSSSDDSRGGTNSGCGNCGPRGGQPRENSRRRGLPQTGGSTHDSVRKSKGCCGSSSSTSSSRSSTNTEFHRQAPEVRWRTWRSAYSSRNREITFSSSTSEQGRRETSSHARSSHTVAATLSHAPVRTGLPRQRRVRSVAARALTQLQPNREFQQQRLLRMLQSQQVKPQQQQFPQRQLQLNS